MNNEDTYKIGISDEVTIRFRINEALLDREFLMLPIVAAQRIQREYIKTCLRTSPRLLSSTLLL